MDLLRVKVDQLEKEVVQMKLDHDKEMQSIKDDMKEHGERIRNTEMSISRIEIIVDGLKGSWQSLEGKLEKVIESGSSNGYKMATEILKWSAAIVAGILGAKMFL